jgi:hypothetical protein
MWGRRSVGLVGVVAIGLVMTACGSSSGSSGSAGSPGDGGGGGGGDKPADRVLFDTDFQGVCSGAPQAAAAAYDKAVAGIHPVLGFGSSPLETDANKLTAMTIPEGFTRRWAQGQNNLAEVQLVVCAKRIKDTATKTCDGYKKNGVDTGQKVTIHNATFEVKLFAAKTGEQLATKNIDASDDDCPTIIPSGTTDHYPTVDESVVAFVQPIVKTDA